MGATKGVVTYAFFLFSFYFDESQQTAAFFIAGKVGSTKALGMPCEWVHLTNALEGRKLQGTISTMSKAIAQ